MPIARALESTHPHRAHVAPAPASNNVTPAARAFPNKPNQRLSHPKNCIPHPARSPNPTIKPTKPNQTHLPQFVPASPSPSYFQTNPTNPFPTAKTASCLTPRTIKPNQTQQPFPFVPFALFVVHPIFHSRTFASIRGSLLLHTQAFNAARPITTPVTLQGVF
jgi:hypothetical protein